jgi:NAD(P)H-dependent flavin oxidoreductase YrpB (nitropropane dioxygenase family)
MPPVLRTPICDLLGIDVPIMQAGMGGVAYGRLAAAVSNAGGLGSIGGIDITPDELDAEIRLFRTLSSRPLCVDLGFPASAPKGLADVDVPAELPGPLQQLQQELREHGVELGPTHDQAISIADNRLKLEIAACLTMGAQGAWVGTRFLATRESQAEDGFKRLWSRPGMTRRCGRRSSTACTCASSATASRMCGTATRKSSARTRFSGC